MSILILGAGGHAKVIADILIKQQLHVVGFLDDNPRIWGERWQSIPILGGIDHYAIHSPMGLVLGIGSNQSRQAIVSRLGEAATPLWINAIHPTATIGVNVRVGHGIVLAAHVAINPDTTIGNHAIINTGATVDHDCTIEEFSHVAPGVHIAGGVTVGTGSLLGIGATVTPNRTIGAWSTIGAGATVTHDIPAHVTAVGTPARWPK